MIEPICPCQTDVEDPGPHIEAHPYSDPDYDPDPFGVAELEREKLTDRSPDFECFVPGIPRPQGSKTRTRYGGMRESSKYVKAWREDVTLVAATEWRLKHGAIGGSGAPPRLDGPLVLGAEFLFARPVRGHCWVCPACRGRVLKVSAPVYVLSKPDTGKCLRAIEDSLTDAGVWGDDSQVVGYAGFPLTCKRYANPGEQPGARIRIWRVA